MGTLLRKSIKVHTETAAREATHLFRIAKKYKEFKLGHANEPGDPSIIMLFDNGYFTVVSGCGKMFNLFCRDKILGSYTGRNHIVREPTDADYRNAKIRHLPFDRCFSFKEEDVDKLKGKLILISNKFQTDIRMAFMKC